MVGKILVLDDEENYAEMLQSLLQQHRFIVDSATKPEKALEALREKGYDLVISDYKMPVMDGADFLQRSREIKPDLPVILVSGLMNTPELVKVANMSVTLVLEKPIDIGVFIEHVRRFVSPLSEADYHKQMGQDSAPGLTSGSGFIRTYPTGLRYVADGSSSSRQTLQALWDASRAGRAMVISGPAGTEFELILRELALWCFPDGSQPVFIRAADLTSESVAEITASVQERGCVFGITDLRGLAAPQQELLRQIMVGGSEGGGGNIVAIFLEDGVVTDEATDWQAGLLECLVRDPLPVAPLIERVVDLAEYSVRIAGNAARKMERQERAFFCDSALHFLLQYPWPGNYTELSAVIKAAVGMRQEGPVTLSDLTAAIREVDPTADARLTGAGDEDFSSALQLHQNRILRKLADDDGVSVEGLVESLFGDAVASGSGEVPLLFPRLLKPGDN